MFSLRQDGSSLSGETCPSGLWALVGCSVGHCAGRGADDGPYDGVDVGNDDSEIEGADEGWGGGEIRGVRVGMSVPAGSTQSKPLMPQ